jgi:AcrR family transcriptional regulator
VGAEPNDDGAHVNTKPNENLRDRQREETRARLYRAALEVFRRDGYDQCRIDDIATLAQVSRAAFYFHFPTKEDVLRQLVQTFDGEIAAQLEALPSPATVMQVLNCVAEGFSRLWRDEAPLIGPSFAIAIKDAATDRDGTPLRQVLSQRLQQVMPAKGPLATPSSADFYLLLTISVLVRWSRDTKQSLPAMLAGATHIFLHGAQLTVPVTAKN